LPRSPFVYDSGILLEGSFPTIFHDVSILVLGTVLLVFAVAGYLKVNFPMWQRIVLLIGGILTCIPEDITDVVGLVIGGAMVDFESHCVQQREEGSS
jgi:TRAP-type uncharacterized transport system fused permease subunit